MRHGLSLELREKLCKQRLGGYKFRFQSPVDVYSADFLCATHRLIVEVDGISHADRKGRDAKRDLALQQLGYITLRFTEAEVQRDMPTVLAKILNTLEARPRVRY